MREKVKEGMKNAKMFGEQPADEADMLEVITNFTTSELFPKSAL